MMDGFKGHIIAEPVTWLYTNAVMTRAADPGSSDADAGIVLLDADPSMQDDGTHYQVLGDSAYGSGAMLEHLDAAGHQGLVKPKPLRPAVPGSYDRTTSPTTKTRTDSPAPPVRCAPSAPKAT